ncbi:MAG: hypothetical protein M3294_04810 [Pseudomonadota bacterium]|nr:hypothetical protein [Pseudomonadota bacterium]
MPNTRGLGGSGTRWNMPSGIGERLRAREPVDFESRDWLPVAAGQAITPSLNPTTLVPRHFAALSLNSRVLRNAHVATAIGLCLSIPISLKRRFSMTPASVWWDQEMVSWLSQTEVKALVHGTL